MTEYWTCRDDRNVPDGESWHGCGQTHTSLDKASACCREAHRLSGGHVHREPIGGPNWSRQELREAYESWLSIAAAAFKNGTVGMERWLLHPIGTNRICDNDKIIGSLLSHHLRKMDEGVEREAYKRWTKKWDDAGFRQQIAKHIREMWPTLDDRRAAKASGVAFIESKLTSISHPSGVAPEDEPDVEPEPKKERAKLSEKAKVLRDLLELDDMETQVYDRVMEGVADNEPLLDKICARANVPRSVTFTMPNRTVTVHGHQHPDLEIVMQAISGGVNRVFTWGSPGLGKTHAMKQVAEALDMPFFLQTPVSDQYQLLGFRDASGDYHESEVYRWATCEGPAMLLLDEVDGCHPNAVLALNAMLENKTGVFPTGRVEFGDEKVATATANTPLDGATAKHNARFMQDGAFKDRWVLQFKWRDDPHTEQMIAQIKSGLGGDELRHAVQASRKVRSNLEENGIQIEWGPRRTFAVARLVAAGFTCRKACELSGLHRLDEGQRKRALTGVGAL